ncbi:multicopper oxidase domain-containing protein [Rhodoferax sp.]|uniref:multicopper oxidase domain-containing protein n=1 Tax=Rhodoferax sp. TaxID=50421 RepID=UPI0028406B21|nr:multicopper oxidase domain-containing protein [Rhodoferax sp.]
MLKLSNSQAVQRFACVVAICVINALLCGGAQAQLLRTQCPTSTVLHPLVPELINGVPTGKMLPNPSIKCQEISGGDGYATMADGSQTYLFGFGPLSGIDLISQGKPGTQTAAEFNTAYNMPNLPGLDAGNAMNPVPDPTYVSSSPPSPNGGVLDAAAMMNIGVLAAQQPAPLMAINEDDEYFLTLSNVGMIMRPDLFEQHTVHFHGYPNASSYFDGVPDASIAISISGSMTYYYTAPDAGTYFFHCHITPPEHLQMGMVGQLYVRPRQDVLAPGDSLRVALVANNTTHGLSTDGVHCADILCTGATPAPPTNVATREPGTVQYAYNDGDGSTAYDVEYPMQLMGFDPAFHFVGMTFNPEDFSGMKDKYFMISGRSYPDTVSTDQIRTQDSDGLARPSQPISSKIVLTSCTSPCAAGITHRALLRVSDLNVTEFHTLATNGIPMKVIAWNARLLRDMAGNNLAYDTNSITLGGGESADVIIDSADVPKGTYFVYTTNLDHLSNDAENLGGMMTEILVQ